MTDFGVSPAGFTRPTIENLVDQFEADQLSEMAADLDVDIDQPIGQLNGIYARELGIAWEQLELLYHAFDPDAAEGRLLDMLAKLTGTFRKGSTPSEVLLRVEMDDGTTIQPNVFYAAIEDKPNVRWTLSPTAYPSGYTAVGTGFKTLTFISELLGPVQGFAGTIKAIGTPTVGVKSVVNPDDAELGTETDLDPAFRARRETELASIGSATIRAITANIAQAFSGKLQTLVVFENDGDNVDSNGLPPHSIEVLIFDGDVPSVDNDQLAQVIFDSKAGGIQTGGNTSGNANALVNGLTTTKAVKFSRASQLSVYLDIHIIKKIGVAYIGDEGVKQQVALLANAYFAPGEYIVRERLESFVLMCQGVQDLSATVKLGYSANPTATANLPVTIRQIGRFSTSRITVTSA